MEVRLYFQYNHPHLPSIGFSSEWMAENVSLAFIKDLEKTGRMKELTIEDDMGQTWNLKEYKKLLTKEADVKNNVKIEFDGSFNPEIKESGIGFVLHYQQSGKSYRIRQNARFSHLKSNNEAEYAALYSSLQKCHELGISNQKINVQGDSLVVINQVSGEWPCYEEELNKWLDKIESLCKKINIKLHLQAVRRNDNKEADKLAAQALNDQFIQSESEIK